MATQISPPTRCTPRESSPSRIFSGGHSGFGGNRRLTARERMLLITLDRLCLTGLSSSPERSDWKKEEVKKAQFRDASMGVPGVFAGTGTPFHSHRLA
jgi:hypothetical protein